MQRDDILPPIKVSVKSGEHAAREALTALLSDLKALDLDIEEAGTIELVVAEVLNNICEHAYSGLENAGSIEVECVHASDGLHFDIRDAGKPMPNGRTPLGMPANLDVDFMDLPEGGFGWFLIQDLAKDVEYQRIGTRNQLSLRIAVGIKTAA